MKKTSFIILMCVIALSVGAKQKEKLSLIPIVACSSPDGYNHRHKAPSKKPLQVYCDDAFVYLQNAIVGGVSHFWMSLEMFSMRKLSVQASV